MTEMHNSAMIEAGDRLDELTVRLLAGESVPDGALSEEERCLALLISEFALAPDGDPVSEHEFDGADRALELAISRGAFEGARPGDRRANVAHVVFRRLMTVAIALSGLLLMVSIVQPVIHVKLIPIASPIEKFQEFLDRFKYEFPELPDPQPYQPKDLSWIYHTIDDNDLKRLDEMADRVVTWDFSFEWIWESKVVSPLGYAAAMDNREIVDWLIAHGAEVNYVAEPLKDMTRNELTGTALGLAASPEVAALLVEAGADVNKIANGLSPLQYALKYEHAEVAAYLIEQGADVRNGSPLSPLGAAAHLGYSRVADMLIQRGADVNGNHLIERSPLQAAAASGSGEIVGLLLTASAAPGLTGTDPVLPLQHAALIGDTISAGLLLKHGACVSAKAGSIWDAAISGDTAALERQLGAGAEPDGPDSIGGTPLVYAAALGRIEAIDVLLDAGADADGIARIADGRRLSPLGAAVIGDKPDCMRLLLDRGADPNGYDEDLVTPLHVAATHARARAATVLLDAGAEVNAREEQGWTPLTRVINSGADESSRVECARVLLKSGADANQRDRYDRAALHQAIWLNSAAMVRVLLENGADPDVPGSLDETPLNMAIGDFMGRGLDIEIIRLLLKHGARTENIDRRGRRATDHISGEGALVRLFAEFGLSPTQRNYDRSAGAAKKEPTPAQILHYGQPEQLQALIGNGLDLEQVNENSDGFKSYPLGIVAKIGNVEKGRLLLEAGASPDGPPQIDWSLHVGKRNIRSPLEIAVEGGKDDFVALLLEFGADPDGEPGVDGPLHIAVHRGRPGIVAMLLDAGADVNHIGDRASPIFSVPLPSARGGFNNPGTAHALEVLELLLSAGPDLKLKDKLGRNILTAGHGADYFRILLEHGVDPNMEGMFGNTALHGASAEDVRVLVDFGADVNYRNSEGVTPLASAAYHGSTDAVAALLEAGAIADGADSPVDAAIRGDRDYFANSYRTLAELNAPSIYGRTPLHYAAAMGRPEILEPLFKRGLNPDPVEKWEDTPLTLAVKRKKLDAAEYLLEHGANPDHVGRHPGPILHSATSGPGSMLRLLIEHGADPDIRDKSGNTALWDIWPHKDLVYFQILLDAGTDVNAVNDKGETILDKFASRSDKETFKLLRSYGAKTGEELKAESAGAPAE